MPGATVPIVGVPFRAPFGASVAGTPRRLPHDEVVVRQGESSTCLFLVTWGAVRLASVTVEGRELVVGLLGAGDLFGESALLDEPSPVQARVVGCADLVPIPVERLHDLLRRHPATGEELLRLVAARLHRTGRALEEAMSADLPTRVSSRLRDLADTHGVAVPEGVRIDLPLSQDELARMVGASREAVNRTLGGLTARGLVSSRSGTVVVADPSALGDRSRRTVARPRQS